MPTTASYSRSPASGVSSEGRVPTHCQDSVSTRREAEEEFGPAAIQAYLEKLYKIQVPIAVEDFLIDRKTLEAMERTSGVSLRSRAHSDQVILVESTEALDLGVYLDESTMADLRRRDPRVALASDNLESFCSAVEEISHFIYIVWNTGRGRPISQLELELQAEVDKYLACAFLLFQQRRCFIKGRLITVLFETFLLADRLDPEQRVRYTFASRLGRAYCRFLEDRFLDPPDVAGLLREVRGFYRLGQAEKIGAIHRKA